MFWVGLILLVLGTLMGLVGWFFNTETPIQQPLPAVGVVLGLIGIGLMFWFH